MDAGTIIGHVAAVLTTVSFLPQAIQTIKTKETEGISIYMYSLFTVGVAMWLAYGIYYQILPIILANSFTIIFAIIILTYKIRSMAKDSVRFRMMKINRSK